MEARLGYAGALRAHCRPHAFVACSAWLVVGGGAERGRLCRARVALDGDVLLLATGEGLRAF